MERIDRVDPETGLLVRQVTSAPTVSRHMHYETPTFTPDGEGMLFVSMRVAGRGSPWDLFTCRSDGNEIVQLSGGSRRGMSNACLSVDGHYAYYMEDGSFHRTRLDSAEDDEVGRMDDANHYEYYRGARSWDDRWYISMVRTGNGSVALVRWDVETGEHVVIVEADKFNHPKPSPGGPEFQVSAKYRLPDGGLRVVPMCIDVGTLEKIDLEFNSGGFEIGHNCWLGGSGDYQATLREPYHGIIVMRRDGGEPERVAEGPYFWHSGASLDGRWIVADTSYPDEGIWLINVSTRRRELLCFAGASQGNHQWTHPHPNLSDDGSMVVFTSDASGISQVHVVYIPDDLRERLSGTP